MNRKQLYKNYNLEYYRHKNVLFLRQQMIGNLVTTKGLPNVVDLLTAKIPTIFKNECFNNKKNSFKKEVRETEIGHLLEHLILENLKILAEQNHQHADFMGVTLWDWEKDNYGLYKIEINVKDTPPSILKKAIISSLEILEEIFATARGEDQKSSPPVVS